jgi:hypothetical protein
MNNDFDKRFKRNETMFNIVFGFVSIVFVTVFAFYIFIGYNAVKVIGSADFSRPEKAGEYVGRIVKGFNDGIGK